MAGSWIHQGRELAQHFSHLVPPLAAPDVDDDVGFGILGERLLDHRLPGAETTWHRDGATLRHREEKIEDPLSGNEWAIVGEPRRHRAGPTHRPKMCEAEFRSVLQPGDRVTHRVLPRRDVFKHTRLLRRHHHAMLDPGSFRDGPEHVTWAHRVTGLCQRREAPEDRGIEGFGAGTWLDEITASFSDLAERPAYAIEDRREQARAQRHRERIAGG